MSASSAPRAGRRALVARARPAILVAAALAASEALAQAMLGRPVMAQLLAPSLWALPALLLVIAALIARLALVVVFPSACAAFVVWQLARRLSASPRAVERSASSDQPSAPRRSRWPRRSS